MTLTERQQAVYDIIQRVYTQSGRSPTFGEMAEELGVSKTTVAEHVGALVKAGAVHKVGNKSRGLIPSCAVLVDREILAVAVEKLFKNTDNKTIDSLRVDVLRTIQTSCQAIVPRILTDEEARHVG